MAGQPPWPWPSGRPLRPDPYSPPRKKSLGEIRGLPAWMVSGGAGTGGRSGAGASNGGRSGSGADTGVDSEARMRAANSLFVLILLFWLGVNRAAGGLASAADGGLDWGTAGGLDSGLVLDRGRTLWDVHGAIVICPDPEQRVESCVI